MVAPINSRPTTTKTSIFYVNDIHGNAGKMEKIKSASNKFNNITDTKKIDALKLCSGDTLIGANDNKNQNAVDFLNAVGFDAMTLGNHELDNPMTKAAKYFNQIKGKIVTTNLVVPEGHVVEKELVKTFVKEINGNKYGILGIQPYDIVDRVTSQEWLEGTTAMSKEDTLKALQKEIDKFEKQGINKIILLSHAGFHDEQEIAKNTEGIDIIIGGHSHNLLKGVTENQNLFYSKRNEPVVLTQAYKNGDYFGVLNLGFDNKGVLTEVQNNVTPTRKFSADLLMAYYTNKNLGAPKIIGQVANKMNLKNNGLLEENPYANLITDAMKNELDTDIAILNCSNVRGVFQVGALTDRDVSEITPFNNKMTKIRLNQKDLIDAIKYAGKTSFAAPDHKPGLLQASGINYIMNKKGELLSADFVDKEGNKIPINIDEPDENITYVVAIDNYYGSGRENFTMLNKIDEAIEIYDFDKDKLAINYIKKMKQPLEFKKDGRIKIV